jgi:hypothetical protein
MYNYKLMMFSIWYYPNRESLGRRDEIVSPRGNHHELWKAIIQSLILLADCHLDVRFCLDYDIAHTNST